MGTSITFDTYEFVQSLKQAGMDEKQAEAISIAVRKSQANLEVATKQDVADLRKEITDVKYELLKWMVGFALTNAALLVGILFKIMSLPIGIKG